MEIANKPSNQGEIDFVKKKKHFYESKDSRRFSLDVGDANNDVCPYPFGR